LKKAKQFLQNSLGNAPAAVEKGVAALLALSR
jgi:hypothetical protein